MDTNLVQYTLKYHGKTKTADCRAPSDWELTTSLRSISKLTTRKTEIFFMLFIPWIVDN